MLTPSKAPVRQPRIQWHRSQYRWHAQRFAATGDPWHAEQCEWHEDRFRMWAYPLPEQIVEAFRRNAPAIAANITRNNALLTRLKGRQ